MYDKLSTLQDQGERFDEELGRMLHVFFPQEHRRRPRLWRPPTDVYETEQAIIVQVELAGMKAEEIEISYTDRLLSIRGSRQDPRPKVAYHRMEIPYGEFASEILLPGNYVEDKIEAKYENGFLMVSLPKKKPYSIQVHATRE